MDEAFVMEPFIAFFVGASHQNLVRVLWEVTFANRLNGLYRKLVRKKCKTYEGF